MIALGVLLLIGLSFAEEKPKKLDRCEYEYKRCEYECVIKYPISKNKQDGCKLRCSINKAYCESGQALKEAGKEIKEFFEGLLGYEGE